MTYARSLLVSSARTPLRAAVLSLSIVLGACSLLAPGKPPLPTAQVDLRRYQGPWFVIASIPIGLEKNAYNGVETYTLNPDGSIATVFQYREGSFHGDLKTVVGKSTPRDDSGNAVWDVQVIWPLSGDYRIVQVEPDYSVALIGQQSRDHAWVLSRKPIMSDAQLDRYRNRFAGLGYDLREFRRIPQDGSKPSN